MMLLILILLLSLGEHGGSEFPVIVESNGLTVLGMDNGFTKVALPFSVRKDRFEVSDKISLFRFRKFGHFKRV